MWESRACFHWPLLESHTEHVSSFSNAWFSSHGPKRRLPHSWPSFWIHLPPFSSFFFWLTFVISLCQVSQSFHFLSKKTCKQKFWCFAKTWFAELFSSFFASEIDFMSFLPFLSFDLHFHCLWRVPSTFLPCGSALRRVCLSSADSFSFHQNRLLSTFCSCLWIQSASCFRVCWFAVL